MILPAAQRTAGAIVGDTPWGPAVLHFGDWLAEYKALTSGVGVTDFSTCTQIELTGADRASFLHNFCTNEIRKLAVGEGCEAMVLDGKGHVQFFVYVFCRDESLVVETVPGQGERLIKHLDRYLISEKVTLHDRSAEWSELLVAGARSADLLSRLVSGELPNKSFANVDTEFGKEKFPVSIRRVPMTQPFGFLLSSPRAAANTVWTELVQAGAMACGDQAIEAARIEAGMPWYTADVTERNLPQELARDDRAISFVKGCYLGQETVARIDALGHVNRTLVGVRFSGEKVPSAGDDLLADNQIVGQVTSATFSPRLNAPLALAYVRRGGSNPGTAVQWSGGTGEVVSLPLA
jgi:folate-binding protein YgfZ